MNQPPLEILEVWHVSIWFIETKVLATMKIFVSYRNLIFFKIMLLVELYVSKSKRKTCIFALHANGPKFSFELNNSNWRLLSEITFMITDRLFGPLFKNLI